ncbi:MAG: hypothetical protein K8T90_19425 [Planctomycetes bacterium]|nr:hypothetical protein [Planctomycetota bacterium]
MTAPAGSALLEPLRKKLAGRTPPCVIAAVGPESFLREEVLHTVATAVLGSADSPDLITVHGDDETRGSEGALAFFFDEARTGSLFGGAKVVVLREADEAVAADHKAFIAWITKPSSSITVVLLAEELPADVVTAAKESGIVIACGGRGVHTENPARFAVGRAAAKGKRLGIAEAEELVRLVSDDLSGIENAVEVLCLHAGDEPAIDPAAIRALFPGARMGVAEEFAELLLAGDIPAALTAAGRCFDEGVPEAWGSSRIARDEKSVAFVLVREFGKSLLNVLSARRQLDAGVPRHSVAIKGPSFLRDRAVRTASMRRPESLDSMMLLLEETDRGMKSGGASGRVAISRLATAAGRLR